MEAGRCGNVEVVMRLNKNMCGSEALFSLCTQQSNSKSAKPETRSTKTTCPVRLLDFLSCKKTKNKIKNLTLKCTFYDIWSRAARWSQRDVYLSWPIAPSYMCPNAGGGGGCGVTANEYSFAQCTLHMEPNKLWRSNSIFNLCWQSTKRSAKHMYLVKYREKKVFSFYFCLFVRKVNCWKAGWSRHNIKLYGWP